MINVDQGTSLCDIKYKIVFLGDMSVGKTSIIQRFIHGFFDQKIQHTVGIDFLAKNITYNEHLYRLQLWDTAGQEKFRSLIPAYLRDAHCAVMVFDITEKQSFKSIEQWRVLFGQYKQENAIVLLVGNKIDLLSGGGKSQTDNDSPSRRQPVRRVSQEEAFEYAAKHHMGYCQVSAKKGNGIQIMFESIIENIEISGKSQGSYNGKESDNGQYQKNQPKINSNENMVGPSSTGQISRSNTRVKRQSRINRRTIVTVPEIRRKNWVADCCHI